MLTHMAKCPKYYIILVFNMYEWSAMYEIGKLIPYFINKGQNMAIINILGKLCFSLQYQVDWQHVF